MTNCLSVADLWGGKLLAIGNIPLSISNSNSYDKKYYIDRIVTHQAAMKDDVLIDKEAQKIVWFAGLHGATIGQIMSRGSKKECSLAT